MGNLVLFSIKYYINVFRNRLLFLDYLLTIIEFVGWNFYMSVCCIV